MTRLALYTPRRWEGRDHLTVKFLNGEPWMWVRVAAAIDSPTGWNGVCGLPFVFIQFRDEFGTPALTNDYADIRITLDSGTSWSYEGSYAADMPQDRATMQLGWLWDIGLSEAEIQRVSLHEFGHALAFNHEQQNPDAEIPWDREKVYAYYARFGWSRAHVDSNVLTPTAREVIVTGGYDPASIMHYGTPAELLTDPSRATETNYELSEMDKVMAAEWYGKPVHVPPVSFQSHRLFAPMVFG